MHIAHFTNTYKPNINGVVRSVSTYRDVLSKMGHNIFIFAQRAKKYKDTEPFVFRYPAVSVPGFDYSLTVPASRFIDRVLPILKIDVIHSNHPILVGDAAVGKAKKLNLPLVFTFHSRYTEYGTIYVPISKAFVEGVIAEGLARYMKRCQHIIAPSESIKRTLEEFGGIKDRITIIPTGIDLIPYKKSDGRPIRQKYNFDNNKVLVSIGRLTEEKNWEILLAAVSQVMQQKNDVRFMLIGDGHLRKDLEEYANKLGIGDRVVFTGIVPFDQVPNYLKAGDLFCFASVVETQGLATMEAMAAGLPVVATKSIGTSDIVDHEKEGFLVNNDTDELALAILHAIENEELCTQFGRASEVKAKNFNIKFTAQRLLEVYRQAIDDKKANRFVEVDMDLIKEQISQNSQAVAI